MKLLAPFAVVVLLLSAGVASAAGLTLRSSDLAAGQFAPRFIYNESGCTGGNVSPALAWSGAPAGTKSFAVTIFDPDAPTGHGWWHWVVYDIPATVHALPEDAGAASGRHLPQGARQTANDFGGPGYGGPCPPPGPPHRYVFTLYALDAAAVGAAAGSGAGEMAAALKPHALATVSFTVPYGR
jgi:Raf kinase inhibitor-like YbhB/YbcL family protein